MTCVHLNQLVELCRDSQIQLSSAELIHLVCNQCNQAEVCPSVLTEEYDQRLSRAALATPAPPVAAPDEPALAPPEQ